MAHIEVPSGTTVAPRGPVTPYSETPVYHGLDQLAAGVGELGAGVDKALDKATKEANATAANDALTQFQSDNISALDGNSQGGDGQTQAAPQPGPNATSQQKLDAAFDNANPPSSFLSSKGTDAVAQSAPTLDYLAQRRQEIADDLNNKEQRELFLKHSEQIYLSSRARVETHAQQQRQQAMVDSLSGRAAVGLNDIANNYSDEGGGASKTEEAIAQSIRAFRAPYGDADAAVAQWRQKAAETRLNMYLSNKDWQGAQTYYAQVKDNLGAQAAPFNKQIATLKQDQQGEGIAAQFVADSKNPENGKVDPAAALAKLDTIPDIQLRDEIRQRLAPRLAAAQHDWSQRVDNVNNLALSSYLEAGNDIYSIPSSAKSWLIQNAPEQWYRIEQMARADNSKERNAPPSATQIQAMSSLQVDMADHPEKYAIMSPAQFNSQWLPQLAQQDRERANRLLAETHTAARKGDPLSKLETSVLLQEGRNAGIFDPKQNDPSKWPIEQSTLFDALSKDVNDWANLYVSQNGKKPPLDDVQKFVREKMLQGRDPNSGLLKAIGFGKKTTRLEAEVKGTAFEPKFSSEEQDQAKAALQKGGLPVSDANVDVYLRKRHKLPVPITQGHAPAPATPSKGAVVTPDVPAPASPTQTPPPADFEGAD